uniref:CSON008162 protein n=1 Tax=Culicoides sonorensis TaxID=179676 RepID=A0A336MZC8_CULSO
MKNQKNQEKIGPESDDKGDEIRENTSHASFDIEKMTDENYQTLMSESNKIIRELHGDKNEKYRENTRKLQALLEHYRQLNTQSQNVIQEMSNKISESEGKIQQAIQISQRDQDTIKNLQDEVKSAWKLADAARNREEETHFLLKTAKEKLMTYEKQSTKLVKKEDQSDELPENLQTLKQGLHIERDRLQAEVEELNKRITLHRLYTVEVEKKTFDSQQEFQKLVTEIDEISNEQFKDRRQLEKVQLSLNEVIAEREMLAEDLKHFKEIASLRNQENVKLQNEVSELSMKLEKVRENLKVTTNKLTMQTKELKKMKELKDKISADFIVKDNLLKLKEDQNKAINILNAQLIKDKEILMKRLTIVSENVSAREQEIIKLKTMQLTLEKEIESSIKAFNKEKKYSEKLQREKNSFHNDFIKAQQINTELQGKLSFFEQQMKDLETELKSQLQIQDNLKAETAKVGKERDKCFDEYQLIETKLEDANLSIETKINQIEELKETINQMQLNINQVQRLFDEASTERYAFQREVEQFKKEVAIKNDRLKSSAFEIEKLRNDAQVKSMELNHLNKIVEKSKKENQSLKVQIQKLREKIENVKEELQSSKIENSQLRKTIIEDEQSVIKLRKCKDEILHEKDLIGTQLVNRNDEIKVLKEKISIQQTALDRGDAEYQKRLNDIRLLKIEIQNLTSKCDILTRDAMKTADMRQEVLQLNRALTQERVKGKAFEEDLLTPTNVHRWRKLHGDDPDKLELLEKTHALQNLLLLKSNEALDREHLLDQYKQLLESMKIYIEKAPCKMETQSELNKTRNDLTNMTRKWKALTAELRVMENEIKARDCTIQMLTNELDQVKNELFTWKKKFIKTTGDCPI